MFCYGWFWCVALCFCFVLFTSWFWFIVGCWVGVPLCVLLVRLLIVVLVFAFLGSVVG